MNISSNHPLAITMWDFSWLERRWTGGGYEDWDLALDQLAMRGYDAVRIDAFPHLLAQGETDEWEITPIWDQSHWGSPGNVKVRIQPSLNDFIGKCRDRNIKVGLSAWFRSDTKNMNLFIPTPERHAQIWIKTLDSINNADLLDNILYVDLCNEFPGRNWTQFYRYADREERSTWISEESIDWMRRSIGMVRNAYPQLSYCYSFDILRGWENSKLDFFDLLEPHLWMSSFSDFYLRVGYSGQKFDRTGYDNMVKYAKNLYDSDQDHWKEWLKKGILNLAEWSDHADLPLITTECWAVVDYKDWPGLEWGWVKELCEYGVEEALKTKRWTALATSNFCGPQFKGMWNDIDWHKRMTDKIHKADMKWE